MSKWLHTSHTHNLTYIPYYHDRIHQKFMFDGSAISAFRRFLATIEYYSICCTLLSLCSGFAAIRAVEYIFLYVLIA